MTVNLTKIQTGDTLKLRCGGVVEVQRVRKDDTKMYPYQLLFEESSKWTVDGRYLREPSLDHPFDIIEVIPKPFDWNTVKTGMAFKPSDSRVDKWSVVYYMCHPIRPTVNVCVTNDRFFGMGPNSVSQWPKTELMRSPENDIR